MPSIMLKVKISERLLSDTDKLGYFFAKDRVDTEGIDIENCPTEQVLADFFYEPTPRKSFRMTPESRSHGRCT